MPAPDPQKIKQVLVFDVDKKRYQKFDLNLLSGVTNKTFIYKNHVFFDYLPLKNFVAKHFFRLTKNGIKTNYIADGKTVIDAASLTGFGLVKTDGISWVIFRHGKVTGFDASKVQIVNKDVLADEQFIYNFGQRIPISKLGMKLKICADARKDN